MAASAQQIEAQPLRTNAPRHGLAAKLHVVLAAVDEYNEILEYLREEYAPRRKQEDMLVGQIAENY
jgi:sensor histidine kinase regulating citrate/malate metabolism